MVLLKEFKRGVRFRKGVVQATEKRSFLKLMYIYPILCSNFNRMSRATGLTFFCVIICYHEACVCGYVVRDWLHLELN